MPRLAKTDIIFAHMALHLAADLSPAARRVGAAIIGHFNRKTGQCDPSVERLARMLGLGRRSVLRATEELCEDDGLFERVTHGGRSHRTAYLPRWDRLNDIVADWDLRMKDGSPPAKVSKMSPSTCQKWHVEGAKNGTQTFRSNLLNKPTVQVEGREAADLPAPRDGRKGLGKRVPEPQPQRFLIHAIAGGKTPSRRDAAEGARQRQLQAQIGKLPRHERQAAWIAAMSEE